MADFTRRSPQTEWMDTEPVSAADFAACLSDLASVNTVTLARLPTLGFLNRAIRRAGPLGRPLRVLDVGCGEGDMLRRVHRWARRGGHRLELVGIDLNPLGIEAARAATPPSMAIDYRVADAFGPGLDGFDLVLSSLFTHHLPDAAVVRFLRMMERCASLGWFVNDLHRDRLAYHGFQALSALAGWHRFVRHDGPVSVARSFRRADWTALLAQAGLQGQASVRWHLPYRYCVSRLKPSAA